MKHKTRFEQTAVTALVTTLYHKGYRGLFTMTLPQESPIRGELRACLESCFTGIDSQADLRPFELKTKLPYDSIECVFQVQLDYAKGFVIKEAGFVQLKTNARKSYHINNNNHIPGTQMVSGLFPKPKPWDIHKRKFRP